MWVARGEERASIPPERSAARPAAKDEGELPLFPPCVLQQLICASAEPGCGCGRGEAGGEGTARAPVQSYSVTLHWETRGRQRSSRSLPAATQCVWQTCCMRHRAIDYNYLAATDTGLLGGSVLPSNASDTSRTSTSLPSTGAAVLARSRPASIQLRPLCSTVANPAPGPICIAAVALCARVFPARPSTCASTSLAAQRRSAAGGTSGARRGGTGHVGQDPTPAISSRAAVDRCAGRPRPGRRSEPSSRVACSLGRPHAVRSRQRLCPVPHRTPHCSPGREETWQGYQQRAAFVPLQLPFARRLQPSATHRRM